MHIFGAQGHVRDLGVDLALRFDGSANPVLYLGLAQPGSLEADSAWQIMQIDVTSGVSIRYANGNAAFTNAWTDRATLAYS
jgi:hypothetical protein